MVTLPPTANHERDRAARERCAMTMYVAGEWRGATARRRSGARSTGRSSASSRSPSADDAERAVTAAVEGARAMRSALGVGALRDPAPRRRLLERERRGARPHDRVRGRASRSSRRAARRRGSLRSCARARPRARGCTARRCRSTRRRTAPASSRSRSGSRAASSSRSRRSTIPALLVAHKVGPALAAGNAVVLKPARQTPLTALF